MLYGDVCIRILGIQDICHFILLPGIWDTVFNIFVTYKHIRYLEKNNLGNICQFIRDTCLFTSRDMGYCTIASNIIEIILLALYLLINPIIQNHVCMILPLYKHCVWS